MFITSKIKHSGDVLGTYISRRSKTLFQGRALIGGLHKPILWWAIYTHTHLLNALIILQ
jgi:hypothetical protein